MSHDGLDPASASCVQQTRSAVMTLLAIDGLAIALSGILLRQRESGIILWDPLQAGRLAHLALLFVILVGIVIRLVGTTRTFLTPPASRLGRFYWSHFAGAFFGFLGLPIGFIYGWAVRPELRHVGPFWLLAIAMGLLALPRVEELFGFEVPPTQGRVSSANDPTHDADSFGS